MSLEQQIERVATGLEALNRILSSEMMTRNPPAISIKQDVDTVLRGLSVATPTPEKVPKVSAAVKAPTASEEITNEALSKVTRDLLQRHGRDTVIGLLASIGATKASEIAQEHRAQYLVDAQEMLKK